MQPILKRCALEDLDDLVQISKKTFIDAFEKDNNPDDFWEYVNAAFNRDNLATNLLNSDITYYFVFLDKNLAGYFKLNEKDAQTDIKAKDSLELERIYVLKKFQGQGIGKWMLEEIKKITRNMKKEYLWLGVWERNTGAIKFYESCGFVKFGMHPYYVGKDKQMDWLMRLDLVNLNDAKSN